uniref:Uncharacterized protein n=1 Tax=Lactuca sativa TaxID=4236 RepID=A0A9R1XSD5_LACSA|nr:hypothetical protein LSAT_V11C200100730 [Lactuca sativa]
MYLSPKLSPTPSPLSISFYYIYIHSPLRKRWCLGRERLLDGGPKLRIPTNLLPGKDRMQRIKMTTTTATQNVRNVGQVTMDRSSYCATSVTEGFTYSASDLFLLLFRSAPGSVVLVPPIGRPFQVCLFSFLISVDLHFVALHVMA